MPISLPVVWQNIIQGWTWICPRLWTTLKYLLVAELLVLAVILWISEKIWLEISKSPRVLILGMNPMGAAAIIRWGANVNVRLLRSGRKLLGRYLQKYHPRIYARLSRNLFRT